MARRSEQQKLLRDIGERLRALRVSEGLSVSGLARRARVDRAWLSKVENGSGYGQQGPGVLSLERITTAMGKQVGDIFRRA